MSMSSTLRNVVGRLGFPVPRVKPTRHLATVHRFPCPSLKCKGTQDWEPNAERRERAERRQRSAHKAPAGFRREWYDYIGPNFMQDGMKD